ncbi:MAG: hypothetical protein QGF90_12965 [Gammaproteobacteria bacterium]|jgi:hypothetical protein|nr:hypothetical protein [Gammaproteobacteria bacterium]
MSSLFKRAEPAPEPVAPIPNDEQLRIANERRLREKQRGRLETVLSGRSDAQTKTTGLG